jgi:hypothetical protein
MEYTANEVALAYSPDMMALEVKFAEWSEAIPEGQHYQSRKAFFDIAVQIYGIAEAQFERSQGIRLEAATYKVLTVAI